MTRFKVTYEVDKINLKNDKWTKLYSKSLGIYKKDTIEEVINLLDKKFPDNEIEIDRAQNYASLFLNVDFLSNNLRVESVINIEELDNNKNN